MGLTANFNKYTDTNEAAQHSDFSFYAEVLADDGVTPRPATDFIDAEYIIADLKDNIVIKKTLGDGISVEDDKFLVKVDDTELDFHGAYQHQFVVYNLLGERRSPIFQNPLNIIKTLR